jgi:hypothetical protein
MKTAADIYFPKEHVYEIKILDNERLPGRVVECHVYKNASKGGGTEKHKCAGKTGFEYLLDALGLKGEITADSNANKCNGKCNFIFKIEWENK